MRTLHIIGLLLVASPAAADTSSLQDAREVLRDMLTLHMEDLSLPEAPPTYHLRYRLGYLRQAEAEASFGALVASREGPLNLLGAEVRVGEPRYDNTGFGGWENGFGRWMVPAVPTPHALRMATWHLTDTAYKEAVEHFARKKAAFTPPDDHPGDYITGLVHSSEEPAEGGVDLDLVRALARDLSSVFPRDGSLSLGEVHVAREAGGLLVMDSEGTEVSRPHGELVVRAMVQTRAQDGLLLTDHRTWIVSDHDQLASLEDMQTAAQEMSAELLQARDAPPMQGEYVGPVFFQDAAALDLFRILLIPQVEGIPPTIPFQTRFGGLGGAGLGREESLARVGRRVLPPGWTVVDDPLRDPAHPASFSHDSEGTPARQVHVVTDGIVRDLLSTRVPAEDTGGPNGHCRTAVGAPPTGRAAMLEVTPARGVSRKRLLRTAFRLAADYGHDYVVVVKRLQDDAVRALGDGDLPPFDAQWTRLPPPVMITKLYRDGREEPMRGATFAAVQRWAVRDIVAAGPSVESTWLASFRAGEPSLVPVSGMPTWMRAPEVLVGELELVPTPGEPRQLHALPPPGDVSADNQPRPATPAVRWPRVAGDPAME